MMATELDVRTAIDETVDDIIEDYKDEPETEREALIERIDEECDSLFGRLVQHGRLDGWDAKDLARNASACAAILDVASQDAWVEDDSGLWEGLTYGVVGAVAYYSLRNLLYSALKEKGHDSNDDLPFAPSGESEDENA